MRLMIFADSQEILRTARAKWHPPRHQDAAETHHPYKISSRLKLACLDLRVTRQDELCPI